jgi:hypothetical protein
MNCQTVRSLRDLFLDAELDAFTRAPVEAHLGQCESCRAIFHAAADRETKLRSALAALEPAAAVWQPAELAVRAAGAMAELAVRPLEPELSKPGVRFSSSWREWLWPSPGFYAALASIWLLAFGLHLLTPRPSDPIREPSIAQRARLPSSLWEQRREFAGAQETDAVKHPALPAPRRESRVEPGNLPKQVTRQACGESLLG